MESSAPALVTVVLSTGMRGIASGLVRRLKKPDRWRGQL